MTLSWLLEKLTSVFKFKCLEEYLTNRTAKVSESKFIHTLSESKNIFA